MMRTLQNILTMILFNQFSNHRYMYYQHAFLHENEVVVLKSSLNHYKEASLMCFKHIPASFFP